MELKWGVTEYMNKLFPKLGGLHIAINFLKVIRDHMNGSGLEEIWVESGLLGPCTIKQVLSGKTYNKGVRCHKLSLQALWQILVPSLLAFGKENDRKYHDDIALLIDDKSDNIVNILSLQAEERFQSVLSSFIDMGSNDVNFDFWWNYVQMVKILQLFLKGSKKMEIGTCISTHFNLCYPISCDMTT